MDFLDRLCDAIEADLSPYSPIDVGSLSDGDSIAIRRYATPRNTRYYNGGKIENFGFQILCKNSNATAAINTIQDITDYLDGKTELLSNDGSFSLNIIEVSTDPNWVETTEHAQEVYTALFVAELYREVK
ncbi:phage tail terminator protein [Bacillus swezeyi]|uniref:phage tail terminator protein n=1 Tax=Bacillus swezeyi TaxID=1925020 RepID=UPI0027DD4380|nr:minor capsid protein [Bacillus swezeyi]